jgi:hypothetical protein
MHASMTFSTLLHRVQCRSQGATGFDQGRVGNQSDHSTVF